MKAFFLVITMLVSLSAIGQKCDPSFMFEKIVWPEKEFTLLKPYAIPVHEVKGTPFSVQYSYLFEKGSIYGFYFKPIGKNVSPIKLTLTNSDNEVMKLDTLGNYQEDGVLLKFMPLESDAYNLNLHSAKSFDGCVVFHVSVHRLIAKQTKDGWQVSIPTTSPSFSNLQIVRRPVEKDTVIRKFDLRNNSQSRHAVQLEEGQLYALQIPDDQSAKILAVHVGSGHTDASINMHIVPQEQGYTLFIRSSESGIHAFDFFNSSKDKPAVALLKVAKERNNLPK